MTLSTDKDDSGFIYIIQSEMDHCELEVYLEIQSQINDAQKGFEGFISQSLTQEPLDNGLTRVTTKLKFDTIEHCLSWLDSKVRRLILNQAEDIMGSFEFVSSVEKQSFDSWVSNLLPRKPSLWKINLLVWLALYPSVMVLMIVGKSTLGQLPIAFQMLVGNAITVALTGWLLVPWLSELFKPWLMASTFRWNLLGSAIVFALLTVFLGLFSFLMSLS